MGPFWNSQICMEQVDLFPAEYLYDIKKLYTMPHTLRAKTRGKILDIQALKSLEAREGSRNC